MLYRYLYKSIFSVLLLVILLLMSFTAQAAEENEIPRKNMVTMVDLGADKCVPCKLMAPILKKLESEYNGKAAIVFLDVWKDPDQAKEYGIRVIPTQIFFDKAGKEISRHVGFMDEQAIRKQLDMLLAI
ncbi:MAG: thioredoxin family protein [Proteobacteria bacterium]|nr:thioredoxin family protein [Pseudomonadota bacterium]MBU1140817.1 thioredoxin family protein [Pseudomonadota bacterium]